MQIISKLVDMIQDELDGAEEYAMYALQWKAKYPKLSARLVELSGVEMQHSRILHDEVTRIIESYRQENGEPPKEMIAVYEYEHKKAIKQAAKVKSIIDEYNA